MGTRRRRMRSRRRMRKHKYRMHPPRYGEYFPPPYSSASQIEEYLTTIVMLQNKVTRLEDLLELSQKSFDKRLEDLQLENETLVQELAMAGLGRPQVESVQMDDDEDEAFAEFLAAQDS